LKDFGTNLGLIGPIIRSKIWCSPNKCIFENIKHYIQEIGVQVFSLLHYVLKAFAYANPHHIQLVVRVVTWIRPNFDSVALNVDGSVFFESNLGGFSGLICNNTRPFLHGFLDNISRPCFLHVEILWACIIV